jgi:hypothetical protein
MNRVLPLAFCAVALLLGACSGGGLSFGSGGACPGVSRAHSARVAERRGLGRHSGRLDRGATR